MPPALLAARITAMLACALSCLWPVRAQEPPALPPLPAAVRIVVPDSPQDAQPVRVELARIRAELVGSVARTRVELLLRNPNGRDLEGELQFPLLEGQTVSGFALDIDGRLREASAVPKARGRQVFEDIARARVDPALLQVTQGSHYSLRIYPLPAQGMRRVVLEISEALPTVEGRDDAAQVLYRLPLAFAKRVGQLEVEVVLAGVSEPAAVSATLRGRQLRAQREGQAGVVVRHARSDFEGPELLEVRRATRNAVFATTEEFRGRTYAYAELPLARRLAESPRPHPRVLGLVWDASGSGARRDHAAELALLDAYLAQLGEVEVRLRVVRDAAGPTERFAVRGGDGSALRRRLQQLHYDGATHAAGMSAPEGSDLALLFSDGLGNYGAGGLPDSAVPVLAVGASTGGDGAALRRHAELSGGEFVDLGRLALPEALRRLTTLRTRLVSIDGEGIEQPVVASRYENGGRLAVATVLTQPQASLRLVLQGPGGERWTQTLALAHGEGPGTALAAQQWARLRWTELAADAMRNVAAMERLGLHFRLPTPSTSLIVLEAPADYVRFGIEPPASDVALAQAVERLHARRRSDQARQLEDQLARVTREFAERVQWWERDFPKDAPPTTKPRRSTPLSGVRPVAAVAAEQQQEPAELQRAAPPPPRAPLPVSAPPPLAMSAAPAAASGPAPAERTPATIALRAWKPDSRYARRMRAAPTAENAYSIYLDERPGFEDSTAFFLDASDILLDKGAPGLAARVASNLAEMNLEDRHILRILAYRLMQMGQHRLAMPVLERVLSLAPDEPQSWRDLALARASLGQHQKAIDDLWHVVNTPWHNRFPGIELIALTELNAIAHRAVAEGVRIDVSMVPEHLRRHLPVGLRAVLSWDADNTDIDLWVTDPNGEKAFYGRRLTHQGGLMSRDFTGGYGPEEFSLRHPKPGQYKVQTDFFGHRQQVVAPSTTLMMQLFTDFGTPAQKMKQVILRLSGNDSRTVEVGEFAVEAANAASENWR